MLADVGAFSFFNFSTAFGRVIHEILEARKVRKDLKVLTRANTQLSGFC